MRVRGIVIVTVAVACGLALAQEEQPADDQIRVNLIAEDEPVQDVAAQITEQTGVQIAVTANTEAKLTGKLEDRSVEDSVKLLAAGARASWVRAYLLESAPPEVPYSADELLAKLGQARNEWLESLSGEEQQELVSRAMREFDRGTDGPAGVRAGRHEMLAGPGGGVAEIAAPDGAQRGDDVFTRMTRYADPIPGLLLPERTDSITLDLTNAPLYEALSEFTRNCRFLVVAEPGLAGTVTLSLNDAPHSEALDAIAEASGAQWRTVYVLGQPRPLTEAEIARRQEQRGEQMMQLWGEFWQRPKEERAQWVALGVSGIERMAARMEEATPEERQRFERLGDFAFDFMVGYSTQLTPEQRLELKPVLQALARTRAN